VTKPPGNRRGSPRASRKTRNETARNKTPRKPVHAKTQKRSADSRPPLVNQQRPPIAGLQLTVSNSNQKIPGPVAQDRALVERCLAGEVAAWSEIYRQFHDTLLASIRSFLGKSGQDANLVDEVAARTWYAVVKNDYELLGKFDPRHGCRLSTFLSVLAKNETRVLFRSERRRKSREQQASRSELHAQPAAESPKDMADDELLITLTPAEKTFYLDVLVAQPKDREQAEQAYTAQNLWQLRHRIRKKLERFILDNDA